ncbi:hypothetical protein N9085_02780 [Akkermansiaceae bacterium]|nr:hypothetical protein [bacterium]MDB4418949.1 hypothetical protein [bacterium]MDB4492203.1 hypothetical protein [bacterium]MDB4547614.1 hypothetical protein [Akkermansiaceae bacterium]MDB4585735.1 hypothetical protein [Akkermansiaceae bacterium]
MNHRRQASNLSIPTLIVMLVAGLILSVGGVSYVMVKNKQITLRGKIAKSQERMADDNTAITMHESDISRVLGVFAIRERLAQENSSLQPIPNGLPEVTRPPAKAVAQH